MKAIMITNDLGLRSIMTDLGKVESASISDMLDNGYSYDDLHIYSDDDGIFFDSDSEKEIDTDEAVDGYKSISCWDGNNWKTDIYEENDLEEIEIEIERLEDPFPAYYFRYLVTFADGEKVEFQNSNMSGSLSCFMDEATDEY